MGGEARDSSSVGGTLELMQLHPIGWFGRGAQLTVIVLLYVVTLLGYLAQFRSTGKMAGYPPSALLLFVPVYEEIIFRGVVLGFFERHYGKVRAVVGTSALFGLWHVKNIFWLTPGEVGRQVLYCACILSPLLCGVTLKTRSVWPCVIIHYLNNLPVRSVWALAMAQSAGSVGALLE